MKRKLQLVKLFRGSKVPSNTFRNQSGQAMVEQGLLMATLFGALSVGGVWLMKTHPDMLNAINIQVRGFYFTLSLPFP